jgi:hypothetical protein
MTQVLVDRGKGWEIFVTAVVAVAVATACDLRRRGLRVKTRMA